MDTIRGRSTSHSASNFPVTSTLDSQIAKNSTGHGTQAMQSSRHGQVYLFQPRCYPRHRCGFCHNAQHLPATSQTDPLGDHLLPGNYQIKDWQGRCVDHRTSSSNNFVPVFTLPCKTGKQSQIWNISADIPDLYAGHNYKVLSTDLPVASVKGPWLGHLLLKPDYIDDHVIERVNATHWTLSDSTGGGTWTSWSMNLAINGPGEQQFFTFVGPL
ncbi:hypothetical protein D9758_011352 [Tetrapyrgos nigripes]|uniref:Uncharacterized protein n=1 Tax=Tetrapyrgos nigripes TaxID=182062 RepID=A0A8H5LK63_9AGAR|nr:hypothetical protein D9758_011352 [Tetrapyrgos nigripes]